MRDVGDTKQKALQNSIIGIMLLLALLFIANDQRDYLYNVMNRLKLIPQPEQFTELYFDDTPLLPKEIDNNALNSFSFTVHNMEGVTTSYPYNVSFLYSSGRRVIIESSTVTLVNNASTTVVVPRTYNHQSNDKGRVVVELTSLNQSIDFLITN